MSSAHNMSYDLCVHNNVTTMHMFIRRIKITQKGHSDILKPTNFYLLFYLKKEFTKKIIADSKSIAECKISCIYISCTKVQDLCRKMYRDFCPGL